MIESFLLKYATLKVQYGDEWKSDSRIMFVNAILNLQLQTLTQIHENVHQKYYFDSVFMKHL